MSGNVSNYDSILQKTLGVRQLFYLVFPSETTVPSVNKVPNIVNNSVHYFLSLIVLEYIICYCMELPRARITDAISSLSAGILQTLGNFVGIGAALISYIWLYENYRLIDIPNDSYINWYLAFLLMDFGYYIFHRYSHEVNLLWGAHQVHHSSEDYNLTTALRQSIFQTTFSNFLYIPLAFILPPSHFLIHKQLNTLYQFWIHTECIKTLGPLEYILNTPSHHRVHHGRNRYCIDKNYAGVLIIFDRMFGTFEAERSEEKVAYGLVHPINSWSPLWVQICIYYNIFKRAWSIPGVGNKLRVVFNGPGWSPGKPRTGDLLDIPDIRAPQPRYDTNISIFLSFYVALHFSVVIYLFDILVGNAKYLSIPTLYSGLVLIILCLMSIGFLMECKWYAPYIEVCRLLTLEVCLFVKGGVVYSDDMKTVILQALMIISLVIMCGKIIRKDKKKIQ